MRVAIVSEIHPPKINGVALASAEVTLGLVDAPRGVHTNRARTHCDRPVARSGGGFETLQARSAT